MLKDKLVNFFKDDGNNKKKTENLVFLLVLLIITVVAINVIWNDDKEENTTNNISKQLAIVENSNVGEITLEEKLENILSKISGVGNVDVLLTYNETEEIIPVYNTQDKTSVTNETDSGRGN